MDVAVDRTHLIEVLEGLMDRLTSPDLTLDEANRLRPYLLDLLATLGGEEGARSAHGDPPHRVSSPSLTPVQVEPGGAEQEGTGRTSPRRAPLVEAVDHPAARVRGLGRVGGTNTIRPPPRAVATFATELHDEAM